MNLFVLVSVFSVFPRSIHCYNVDVTVPKIFTSSARHSHFGFSVSFHSTDRILVGAPKENDDEGRTYVCELRSNAECHSLDPNLANRNRIVKWFGVSVSSQNAIDGRALACSHRYYSANQTMFWGACVLFDTNLKRTKYLKPCEICDLCAKDEYKDCQIGASAHIDPSGEILIGGPGYGDGYGNIFRTTYETIRTFSFNADKHTSSKFSYLGSSVRVGRLIDNQITYVTSAPNLEMNGKVFLFTRNDIHLSTSIQRTLVGDVPFSAFGTDLAIGDFNSDGYEDLVVGAPNYYKHGGTTGGAIYVYMNGPEGITSSTVPQKILSRKMKESECISLSCFDARFGFSLGSVGDLDLDGYPDLVVGAPFEGNGVVYVFSGSPTGLKEPYSQRVAASELASGAGPSFGYSLSQGSYDIDSNSYPDLAVGSFLSDRVFVLRTRPVLNADHYFSATPTLLNYKKPSCEEPGVEDRNCVKVTVCFQFKLGNGRSDTGFDMQYNVTIVKAPGSMDRASFDRVISKSNLTAVIRMRRPVENEQECKDHWVYIMKSNKDWLVPIALTMSFNLHNLVKPSISSSSSSDLPSFDAFPILNRSLPLEQPKIALIFDKNCGVDNVCNCNLKVELSSKLEKSIHGRPQMKVSQVLKVDVTVGNSQEDAHQTKFFMNIPKNVKFVGTEPTARCDPVSLELLECDIANPLEADENVTFAIKLNPNKMSIDQQTIVFEAFVNSTSTESDKSDDISRLEFEVQTEADLSLGGKSSPSSLFYSYQEIISSAVPTYLHEIGPTLHHVFEVKNVGQSDLPGSEIVIAWPAVLSTQQPLFYIVQEPQVSGSGGRCHYNESLINPRRLKDRNAQYESLRRPREAQEIEELESLKCEDNRLHCVNIRCSINSLKPRESSVVKIYSRFWNSSFQEAFPNDGAVAVHVKAMLVVPPSVKQLSLDNDVIEVVTTLFRDEMKKEKAPLWIYVVAALAGLLLLVLFILILWRCGFFKRKKHEALEHSVTLTKKEINLADLR